MKPHRLRLWFTRVPWLAWIVDTRAEALRAEREESIRKVADQVKAMREDQAKTRALREESEQLTEEILTYSMPPGGENGIE